MSLKSSRYIITTAYFRRNTEILLQRFYNEVHVWTLLHGRDAKAVPLLGVYSTETHPFGLVYEYMDGLDLKQYLGNDPNVGRLKLVLIPTSTICYPPTFLPPSRQLIEIARGLALMHDLGIVHGKLDAVHRFSVLRTGIAQLIFTLRSRQTSLSTRTAPPVSLGSAMLPSSLTPHPRYWRAESTFADFLTTTFQPRF